MIVDAHTDVLWKMLQNPQLDFYKDSDQLSVNYDNMVKGEIAIQVFAIFVSTLKTAKFSYAIQSVDDFYQKIIQNSDKIKIATQYQDIENTLKEKKKVGILSLEGGEAFEGDISKLRIFYRLGVRAIGLTWNQANEISDGVQEKRNGGLTQFGQEVVQEMNRLRMMVDISHISEKGFWDVIELSESPIMASHSNTKMICNHPRNLTDDQIKALIKNGGMIGVTFVRDFTANKDNPTIDDLILHIEHIAELGGIYNLGLGSDFDGAKMIEGLENDAQLDNLVNALYKKYKSDYVEAILGVNWLNYYKKVL